VVYSSSISGEYYLLIADPDPES